MPYLKILLEVLPIFLIMAVGAAVRRLGILNESADRTLLALVVNLLLPCFIIDNMVANPALRDWGNLFWSPLFGFLLGTLGVYLSLIAAPWCGIRKVARVRTFAFTTGIFNYGYIPIPLVAMVYGTATLGVLFLFNMGVEIAFWTVGVGVLQNHQGEWHKAITVPVRVIVVSVVVNLILAVCGTQLDEATLVNGGWLTSPLLVVHRAMHLLGLCSTPTALMLIGAVIADFWKKFTRTLRWPVIVGSVLLRNVLLPIPFLFLALLPISHELRIVLVVQAAMPAAVFPLLLARHYGGDSAIALKVIIGTSAAGLVTLPLWIYGGLMLLQHLGKL